VGFSVTIIVECVVIASLPAPQ
ncbi:MAG: hypothetical protein JWO31_3499, partial [Phycisphaerales bacterium]|nr:hypothetical protein [Phycisphaerales bacterium]